MDQYDSGLKLTNHLPLVDTVGCKILKGLGSIILERRINFERIYFLNKNNLLTVTCHHTLPALHSMGSTTTGLIIIATIGTGCTLDLKVAS